MPWMALLTTGEVETENFYILFIVENEYRMHYNVFCLAVHFNSRKEAVIKA